MFSVMDMNGETKYFDVDKISEIRVDIRGKKFFVVLEGGTVVSITRYKYTNMMNLIEDIENYGSYGFRTVYI